jgi:hypothetical protein
MKDCNHEEVKVKTLDSKTGMEESVVDIDVRATNVSLKSKETNKQMKTK